MKINSNIPIFAVLTLFIASNALLYQYLNDGYFIDKKPITPVVEVENVIFRLIKAHEDILNQRNAEILLEAERLRNRKLTITDSAELKAIEEKLRTLELESIEVQELVRNSENEKKAAQRKAANNQLQLTELMKMNNQMGSQLDSVTSEFENYVETLHETLESNSFSEKDINTITIAFRNRRGLDYLDDLVGNIQKNRASLNANYTKQLNTRSNEYHQGLKNIARLINDNTYEGFINEKGLLETTGSVEKLKTSINRYLTTKDRISDNKLNSELNSQEEAMLLDLEKQLTLLSEEEALKLQLTLEEQLKDLEEIRLYELDIAAQDKELSLIELEKRLREELKNVKTTVEVYIPTADKPIYTSWVHIPGLWESTSTSLSFSGKKVDSIAWSRNSIEDNQIITFSGKFNDKGECTIILYGNGRFKNWNNGIILSLSTLGPERIIMNITKNGIDENSEVLFTNSYAVNNGINGEYNIQVVNGTLTVYLSGTELIKDYNIDIELSGRIGFANREEISKNFNISNIKLYNIR